MSLETETTDSGESNEPLETAADLAKLLSGSKDDQPGAESDSEQSEEPEEGAEETPVAEQPAADSVDELEWDEDGQKVKAPKAELIKAYRDREGMMRDYTQKTQAIAEERRSGQQAVMQEFEFLERFADDVSTAKSLAQQVKAYEALPWQQLSQEDPQTYAVRLAELNVLTNRAKAADDDIKNKRMGFAQWKQGQVVETANRAFAEVWDHMKKVDTKFNRERLVTMMEAAKNYGFDPQELNAITDKRLVHMWSDLQSKAAAYDEIVKKQPHVQQRIQSAPTKVNKPAGQPTTRQEQIIKRASNGPINKNDFASLLSMSRK